MKLNTIRADNKPIYQPLISSFPSQSHFSISELPLLMDWSFFEITKIAQTRPLDVLFFCLTRYTCHKIANPCCCCYCCCFLYCSFYSHGQITFLGPLEKNIRLIVLSSFTVESQLFSGYCSRKMSTFLNHYYVFYLQSARISSLNYLLLLPQSHNYDYNNETMISTGIINHIAICNLISASCWRSYWSQSFSTLELKKALNQSITFSAFSTYLRKNCLVLT